jgi:hypothetical protein
VGGTFCGGGGAGGAEEGEDNGGGILSHITGFTAAC